MSSTPLQSPASPVTHEASQLLNDTTAPGRRIDVVLVTGGRFHDFDFARRELLGLLAEHDEFRVRVQPDYEDADAIAAAAILVSYTCEVCPSEKAQQIIRAWLERGGRWVALHGTNATSGGAALQPLETSPPVRSWANMVGSRFLAHPPIMPFRVEITDPSHWLVAGINPFETTDELYLNKYPDLSVLVPLLHARFEGSANSFAEDYAPVGDSSHIVMYLRAIGEGGVLCNTLGHCRGHYDMAPIEDYWPSVDRCSWQLPVYYELLRRSLRWARGQIM